MQKPLYETTLCVLYATYMHMIQRIKHSCKSGKVQKRNECIVCLSLRAYTRIRLYACSAFPQQLSTYDKDSLMFLTSITSRSIYWHTLVISPTETCTGGHFHPATDISSVPELEQFALFITVVV